MFWGLINVSRSSTSTAYFALRPLHTFLFPSFFASKTLLLLISDYCYPPLLFLNPTASPPRIYMTPCRCVAYEFGSSALYSQHTQPSRRLTQYTFPLLLTVPARLCSKKTAWRSRGPLDISLLIRKETQPAMDSYQAAINNAFLEDRHPCLSMPLPKAATGRDACPPGSLAVGEARAAGLHQLPCCVGPCFSVPNATPSQQFNECLEGPGRARLRQRHNHCSTVTHVWY